MSSSDPADSQIKVRRFSFGDDLGRPAQERRAADQQAGAAHRAALEEARREAFAQGRAAGRQEAEAETQNRLAEASGRVANGIAMVLGDVDRRTAEIETEALAFFDALARKVAGRAIAAQPLAAIEEAAQEAFRHLRGVPHLAVRVHESLVEPVDATLRAIARQSGFEGRIIVIGSDDLEPGDARLDWADGGVAIARADIEACVDDVIARTRHSADFTQDEILP